MKEQIFQNINSIEEIITHNFQIFKQAMNFNLSKTEIKVHIARKIDKFFNFHNFFSKSDLYG